MSYSNQMLAQFLGLGTVQWVLVAVLIVIVVGYMMYRKKQM